MDTAVHLQGVGKTYPFFTLDDISLSVPTGTIGGLIGANGAGKSTTLRILMGLVRQDRGAVRILGHDMTSEPAVAKQDVGFVSEDLRLYGSATLGWHMQFVQSIFGHWDTAYGEHLLHHFDLQLGRKVKHLSRGQQVKAQLWLALARRPRLMVLDEPTAGLDPIARREVLRALTDILADEERTVLFSSQNTLDIEQICDHISFVDRGRLLTSADKDDLLDSWRSIRLRVPEGVELPTEPGFRRDGGTERLPIFKVSPFEPASLERLTATGATVDSVERMTLEEIFVAAVMGQREGIRP